MDVYAPDIKILIDQLDDAERDARLLVADLAEQHGGWRARADSWSVAECLDHLARSNRVYLRALGEPLVGARELRRLRRRPAAPGFAGRWFTRMIEPPVKDRFKIKAPRSIEPAASLSLADALANFITSQDEVRDFLHAHADLDLAGVRFRNPFIHGIRFSVATGLHIIVAHERRHLWQAWCVRRAAEHASE